MHPAGALVPSTQSMRSQQTSKGSRVDGSLGDAHVRHITLFLFSGGHGVGMDTHTDDPMVEGYNGAVKGQGDRDLV